ncbi:MAG: hypothetical protein JJ911_19350 [Rhizobiaceae bacterium]|nr:hypothetical protein [Rhizobiaceae bacterium]
MSQPTFIEPATQREIDHALQKGQADRAFALLADYLTRNGFSLSDDVFRLYIKRELFACLKGRGHKIDII